MGAWSGESIKSIDLMGVSRTMPISTGLQLVSATLFGVIVFHEWSTTISVVLGVLALVCIIIGVILTSLQSEEEKNAEQAGNFKRGIIILLISTVGYLVYVVVIRLFNVDGWSALLPQAVGMVLGGILLTFKHHPFNKYAIRNIIPGLIWAAGNMFYSFHSRVLEWQQVSRYRKWELLFRHLAGFLY